MPGNDRSFSTDYGKFALYKRKGTNNWQSWLRPHNGDWMQLTTSTPDFEKAKDKAAFKLIELSIKIENGNPIRQRRFRNVAEMVIQELMEQKSNGTSNSMNRHYLSALKNLHIPFFGNLNIEGITTEKLNEFDQWRESKYERSLNLKTVKTHSAALRLVFQKAVEKKYIRAYQVPIIKNHGQKSKRRPYFTDGEIWELSEKMSEDWTTSGTTEKICEVRELCQDLFHFVYGTGCRPGTEIYGIRWKHVEGGFGVDGTGGHVVKIVEGKKKQVREVVLDGIADAVLNRMRKRFPDATGDDLVFRTRSGLPLRNVQSHVRSEFKSFLIATGKLIDNEGMVRSLYSLRHAYCSFKLLVEKMDFQTLALQMGTSVKELENTYSHLTARMMFDEIRTA